MSSCVSRKNGPGNTNSEAVVTCRTATTCTSGPTAYTKSSLTGDDHGVLSAASETDTKSQ
jgi:hypothetical protein